MKAVISSFLQILQKEQVCKVFIVMAVETL